MVAGRMEKKMDKVIKKITAAQSAAILPHINEDADALGSCFAMAAALRAMGKTAVVYVSDEIEKRLSFMGDDYELYIPGQEHQHDLCICLDCGDIGRLGARRGLFERVGQTVNVDHHYSNTCFADENYIEGDASSTGEILYRLLMAMGAEITPEIARQLYTAICSDTGCFKYSNTSAKTMRTAAELLELGVDNAEITRLLFDCESLAAVQLKAEATEHMESFLNGKLRIITMTEEMCKRYDISIADAPALVDIPRMIEGTEIAVCLKEQADGVRMSFRSNGDWDVSKVAEAMGGGGHRKAAGCRIEEISLDEIKERVIKECEYLI